MNLLKKAATLMMFTILFVNIQPLVLAAKFSLGDTVEVYNTGGSGLVVRDAPAGNQIGKKYDGSRGMILMGPQSASYEGIVYAWWKVRWGDIREGWSAEGYPGDVDYLEKVTVSPSTKFSLGDFVKVYNTGGSGLAVRTDPPALLAQSRVAENAAGKIVEGPFYGVTKETAVFHHFWRVDYGIVVGWSAEDWLLETAAGSISVNPSSIMDEAILPGQLITLEVNVTDFSQSPGACGIQFRLEWDSAVLNGVNIWIPTGHFMDPDGSAMAEGNLWVMLRGIAAGYADYAVTYYDLSLAIAHGYAPRHGSGVLANITLRVMSTGSTVITLKETIIADRNANPMTHSTGNGMFTSELHDVATTLITVSSTTVQLGQSVLANVTVENQANFSENTVVDLFLSVYANTTLLESRTIPYLAPLTATTLSFSWNTTGYLTGPYKVTAVARRVPYEADIADNDRPYGMIKVQTANMHVLSVFNHPPLSVLLPFTINQTRSVAPWNGNLTEGTYAVSMPATIVEEGVIYKLKNWENNLTNPTRTINLTNDSNITAYYEASSTPQPTVYASPRVTTKAPDTSFPIDLCVANVSNLHSWEIWLYYDTRFMSALTATEGSFLQSSGATNFQVKELNDAYNATHGRVILASDLTEPSSSTSGNGTLATVTLRTAAIGNSDLYFGQTKLADPALSPISHILLQGISLIRVSVPGDINNDGIVNILDAILLARSFGSRPVDLERWNTNANLNTDSVINILDCIILSNYFGKTGL